MSAAQASSNATWAPVIDAHRVPPSAVSTSQSRWIVRSPSAAKSTTPRIERPMSRWISIVRPSGRPRVASRSLRWPVDAGSIPYSAVTHPVPRPAIQRGTDSVTDAVQITRVSPWVMSAEPGRRRDEAGVDARGAQTVGVAVVGAPASRSHRPGRSTCSISPSGICRNRVPRARKDSTSPVVRNR